MQSSYCCAKLVQSQVRRFSTSSLLSQSRTSFYDSLGITPKATQADVKAAYYELSKVYHPDKNKGCEEASKKFRDISEAYEVLGNVKSRKLYDKGISIGTSLGATPRSQSDDRMKKFYKEREQRTRPSPSGGRQPIYDFDEWSRAHYGATFARDMAAKARRKVMAEKEKEFEHSDRMEKVLLVVGLVIVVCMYFFGEQDYDSVELTYNPLAKPKKKNDDEKKV